MRIPFNRPCKIEHELGAFVRFLDENRLSGDGEATRRCHEWFRTHIGAQSPLLTTSCTSALDMAAILCGVEPGDEVILPSYTFVSTANAFALRGASLVFVDIRPDTMNIDEQLIEAAMTDKTRCIVPVHYAGVACGMDAIIQIARNREIPVVEDAAQGMLARYKGRPLGLIGDLGTYSFHDTKNYTMGEGGVLFVNNPEYTCRAEIIREKGTDRSRFLRGEVDKYSWVDLGSSFLPSELNAAFLLPQLERAEAINSNRLATWEQYYRRLGKLADDGRIELPFVPDECSHNAHMFYFKCHDCAERTGLIRSLAERDIQACSHYVPLHSSPAGKRFGRFYGEDRYTTRESERLVRLPLWYGLREEAVDEVCDRVEAFYSAD